MRRPVRTSVVAALAAAALVIPAQAAMAQPGHGPGKPKPAASPQLEKLDRGLVALPGDDGIHLTWRLFKSEPTGASATGLTGTDSGFFGRILSVRGEFGYWVFEGDWQPAQRPSWNYRAEDGGGIIVDMFPHWNYVLENLFGEVTSVYAQAAIHIADRWDEKGEHYTATAKDAAYGVFELEGGIVAQINSSWTVRVNRDELVEFHVDGTHGSAVVGLFGAKIQPRNATPKPVWNPDLEDAHDYDADWQSVPTNDVFLNGFRQQWEEFLLSYVQDTPYEFDLLAGARGVLLAEAGLQSSREGRKVELPALTLD